MFVSLVGTIAILFVIAPSSAFNVATVGCVLPCGQSVRYPSGPDGTSVALKTYAWDRGVPPRTLPSTFTSNCPVKGEDNHGLTGPLPRSIIGNPLYGFLP